MSLRKLKGLATQNKGVKMPNLHHPGEKSWLPAKDNSPPPISASEVGLNKSAAEWKWWQCLKVTHRFPRLPGCAGNEVEGWGGGLTKRQEDLRGGRGSSSTAAAWSKHFQPLPPPNWKGLFSSLWDERVRARRGKRNDRLESRWRWGG